MNFINTDSRIDDYIQTMPVWQQEISQKIRKLIHEAVPEIIETIKRKNRPYFTMNGNICALLGTKDHVNVFIYDPLAPDPENIINQGAGNQTARAIQIYEGDIINENAFVNLIKSVAINNERGGWRKLQK
jgi:hypothetical protein